MEADSIIWIVRYGYIYRQTGGKKRESPDVWGRWGTRWRYGDIEI